MCRRLTIVIAFFLALITGFLTAAAAGPFPFGSVGLISFTYAGAGTPSNPDGSDEGCARVYAPRFESGDRRAVE